LALKKIEIFNFIDNFLINPVKMINLLYSIILIIAQLIEIEKINLFKDFENNKKYLYLIIENT